MKIENLDFLKVRFKEFMLGELVLPDYNTKEDIRNDPNMYENLYNSLASFGYSDLLVVNEDNKEILSGNQRYKVICDTAEGLGYDLMKTPITVVVVNFDELERLASNLAYNNIAMPNDKEKVKKVLQKLNAHQKDLLKTTGFKQEAIDKILGAKEKIKEKVEKENVKEKVKQKLDERYEDDIPQAPISDKNVGVYVNLPDDFKNLYYTFVNENGEEPIIASIVKVLMASNLTK